VGIAEDDGEEGDEPLLEAVGRVAGAEVDLQDAYVVLPDDGDQGNGQDYAELEREE